MKMNTWQIRCNRCGAIRKEGGWVREQPTAGLHQVHGYCPTCLEALLTELRATHAPVVGAVAPSNVHEPRVELCHAA